MTKTEFYQIILRASLSSWIPTLQQFCYIRIVRRVFIWARPNRTEFSFHNPKCLLSKCWMTKSPWKVG